MSTEDLQLEYRINSVLIYNVNYYIICKAYCGYRAAVHMNCT